MDNMFCKECDEQLEVNMDEARLECPIHGEVKDDD